MKTKFEFTTPIPKNILGYTERIGDWFFSGIAEIEAGDIRYDIHNMEFTKNEFHKLPITYDQFHLDSETVHGLIILHLATEHSDIFLQPTPQEETDESRFINNTLIQQLVS